MSNQIPATSNTMEGMDVSINTSQVNEAGNSHISEVRTSCFNARMQLT